MGSLLSTPIILFKSLSPMALVLLLIITILFVFVVSNVPKTKSIQLTKSIEILNTNFKSNNKPPPNQIIRISNPTNDQVDSLITKARQYKVIEIQEDENNLAPRILESGMHDAVTILRLWNCPTINEHCFGNLPLGLERLQISYCGNLSNELIKQIPRGIEWLDLSYSETEFVDWKYFHNLKVLVLHGSTISALSLSNLPNGIEILDLSSCYGFEEAHLLDLPMSLQYLEISYCYGLRNSTNISLKHIALSKIDIGKKSNRKIYQKDQPIFTTKTKPLVGSCVTVLPNQMKE